MSSDSDHDWTEREALAAEYALGVLEGAERRAAEDLVATDAAFAADVARWRAEIEPFVETVREVPPPPALWDRIDAQIAPRPTQTMAAPPLRAENPGLWSSLAFWRGVSFATAGAAALFAALLVSPQTAPVPPAAEPEPSFQQAVTEPMAAAPVTMEGGAALLAAAYDPAHRRFIVTPTGRYELQPSQVLELWIIVGDKAPRSLGVIDAANPRAYSMPEDVRADLAAGATLAVSIEPTGGSPTGAPTGAVVASGKLTQI
jgi:anti-sigma-K factor RskA